MRDPEAQLLQKYHARNRSSGPGVGSLNEIATFAFSQSERVSKWVVERSQDHIRSPTRRSSALAGLRAAGGQEGNPWVKHNRNAEPH